MTIEVDRGPTRVDRVFTRGDTWIFDALFSYPTTATPLDLTGSTWLLHVRQDGPDGVLFAEATVDTTDQANGYVEGVVANTATTGADTGKRAYYYDLEQTRSGTVVTPMYGWIEVVADSSDSDRS